MVRCFGECYPELVSARDVIHTTIQEEEASFSRTLIKGIERFKKGAAAAQVGGLLVWCGGVWCDSWLGVMFDHHRCRICLKKIDDMVCQYMV